MNGPPDCSVVTPEELRRQLRTLGDRLALSEYELAAYLAVLRHGRLSASDLANEADIPQPRVYDTARSLRDIGLVELRETRPMQIVAVDPMEAFSDLRGSLEAVTGALETMYTEPVAADEALSLVKTRSSILRHLEDTIESAEYELTCALTPELLERFEPTLETARERDVEIELLVAPAGEAPGPETFDYQAVATAARARRGLTTPVIAVADGTRTVYTTRDAVVDGEDRYGVIFNRSVLGFLVSGFFHAVLWTTASPLLENGSPGEFPRRYASVRRCVKDLDALSGPVYANVEGRDVVTGDPVTVSGEVTAVAHDPSEQTASFTVTTAETDLEIGGWMAAYEDVEGHDIHIARDPFDD